MSEQKYYKAVSVAEPPTEEDIQLLFISLEGAWYDIVGSAECFLTKNDKYNYCKQIIKQNEIKKNNPVRVN